MENTAFKRVIISLMTETRHDTYWLCNSCLFMLTVLCGLQQAFTELDTDESGYFSASELQQALDALGNFMVIIFLMMLKEP